MAKTYSTKVEISEFFDHRLYLEAVVSDLRAQGVFSHRTFNRECGFKSPNFIQLVIQGKRNLSEEASKEICQTLQLDRETTKTFLRLREMNLTADPQSRTELLEALLKQPAYAERYELSNEQLTFYSRWYNIPIRELLQSQPRLSPQEISSILIPNVPVTDIEVALSTMEQLGLIEPNEKGWKVVHKQLSTKNEVLHQALIHFHSSMIEIAKQSLSRFTGAQREVSALTLQLTESEFLLLRERIRDFKKDALSLENANEDSQVYQFNFQLFPVTAKVPSKKETES